MEDRFPHLHNEFLKITIKIDLLSSWELKRSI